VPGLAEAAAAGVLRLAGPFAAALGATAALGAWPALPALRRLRTGQVVRPEGPQVRGAPTATGRPRPNSGGA